MVGLFQELLQKLIQQRHQLRQRDAHIADLERYIDELVVKVIDLQPLLLSHDTPPPARPTTSQSTSQPRVSQHQSTTGRHASPFIRQTAPQKIERSRSGLKKFAIGPLQTLLKWSITDFMILFSCFVMLSLCKILVINAETRSCLLRETSLCLSIRPIRAQ